MLKIWAFVVIAVVASITSYPVDEFGLEYEHQLNVGQLDFFLVMAKNLMKNQPDKSHFFSPSSNYRIIASTYLAIPLSDKAAKSLEHGLSFDEWSEGESDVAHSFKADLDAKARTFLGDDIEFESADKIYVSESYSLKPTAMQVLGDSIERVDFSRPEARRRDINAWVEEVTRNNIKDLIPAGSITQGTQLVLANAAYFKGAWKNKFDRKNTKNETFYGATPAIVEMMSLNSTFNYGVLPEFSYLKMPYQTEDDSLAMFALLPTKNSPTAVDDVLNNLSFETLCEVVDGQQRGTVNVKFPIIKLASGYEMKKTLSGMGFEGLPFDEVRHKAKIEVNEEGTVAAAATAAIGRGISKRVDLNFDRPFAFFINNIVTSEVLFGGIYRGPAAAVAQ